MHAECPGKIFWVKCLSSYPCHLSDSLKLQTAGPLWTTFSLIGRTVEALHNIQLQKALLWLNEMLKVAQHSERWNGVSSSVTRETPPAQFGAERNDVLPSVAWLRDMSNNNEQKHITGLSQDCHMITLYAPEVRLEQNGICICAG